MSEYVFSGDRGTKHCIIQRIIDLLIERLHLAPEIELNEYTPEVTRSQAVTRIADCTAI